MKNLLKLLLPTLLLGGCVSVERSVRYPLGTYSHGSERGIIAEHIHVSNFGYYLFNRFPLFCGDTRPGYIGSTRWFAGSVDPQSTLEVLQHELRYRPGNLCEVQPKEHATCFFSCIPYLGNSLGIIWYKESQVSATLITEPKASAKKKGRR